MNRVLFFIILFHTCIIINICGQTNEEFDLAFPEGLSIQYGFGRYSIRDEYISSNRYTGIFPEFNIKWSQFHCNHGFELEFNYVHNLQIKNYNAVATIQEYFVSGRNLYPIMKSQILRKQVYFYLGPSWDFYFHLRSQNMASSLFTKTISLAALTSGGINIKSIMSLTSKLQVENSFGTNIFS